MTIAVHEPLPPVRPISIAEPDVPVPPPGEDDLPFEDGVPMESEVHAKQQQLLVSSLTRAWDDRRDYYVGGNMFVYYSELQSKKNDFRGPDVFVVLDTVRRMRKSWVVWGEGGRTPDVVIELLSPTTEHMDRGEKMRIYARVLHVASYYLYDPLTAVFEGYALDSAALEYVRLAPEAHGDLPCTPLGLRLGVRQGRYQGIETAWLRWLDAEGRPLETDEEAALAAQQRVAEEAKARAAAEQRLAEALAELARLKGSAG